MIDETRPPFPGTLFACTMPERDAPYPLRKCDVIERCLANNKAGFVVCHLVCAVPSQHSGMAGTGSLA